MEYKVTVATGALGYSGTTNYVYLTLVGEKEQSERKLLDKSLVLDLCKDTVSQNWRLVETIQTCWNKEGLQVKKMQSIWFNKHDLVHMLKYMLPTAQTTNYYLCVFFYSYCFITKSSLHSKHLTMVLLVWAVIVICI